MRDLDRQIRAIELEVERAAKDEREKTDAANESNSRLSCLEQAAESSHVFLKRRRFVRDNSLVPIVFFCIPLVLAATSFIIAFQLSDSWAVAITAAVFCVALNASWIFRSFFESSVWQLRAIIRNAEKSIPKLRIEVRENNASRDVAIANHSRLASELENLLEIRALQKMSEDEDKTASSSDNCDAPASQENIATRKAWTYSTRMRVWNKFDRKCYICHQPLYNCTGEYMHLDHRQPISKGGPDIEENLAACCVRCNLEKHDHDEPSLYSQESI